VTLLVNLCYHFGGSSRTPFASICFCHSIPTSFCPTTSLSFCHAPSRFSFLVNKTEQGSVATNHTASLFGEDACLFGGCACLFGGYASRSVLVKNLLEKNFQLLPPPTTKHSTQHTSHSTQHTQHTAHSTVRARSRVI
jgi:hypothetical protein